MCVCINERMYVCMSAYVDEWVYVYMNICIYMSEYMNGGWPVERMPG